MKILTIMQCANLGGMEKDALARMAGLAARGHQCRLISLNPIGNLGPLLDAIHIPAQGLAYEGKWGWRSLARMRPAFRSTPSDALIMVGHNVAAMLALGRLCERRRLLSIHHYHTGARPRWQWKLIYRLARQKFPAVIFPCDFIRREAEELYPPIAEIAHTLRNSICIPALPTAAERFQARAQLGLPPDAKIIGSAGWLIKSKRLDVFLRVAQAVAATVPEARFVIAGDGPLRAPLVELSRNLGIADRVHWLGWQANLTPFYSALDVLLFNSDREALGMTPLEAIAHGVPVVASVVEGGLREAVESGQHLFLAPTHDVDGLAEKVVFVLTHTGQAREMTHAGRRHLASSMSVDRHVSAISKLLQLEAEGSTRWTPAPADSALLSCR